MKEAHTRRKEKYDNELEQRYKVSYGPKDTVKDVSYLSSLAKFNEDGDHVHKTRPNFDTVRREEDGKLSSPVRKGFAMNMYRENMRIPGKSHTESKHNDGGDSDDNSDTGSDHDGDKFVGAYEGTSFAGRKSGDVSPFIESPSAESTQPSDDQAIQRVEVTRGDPVTGRSITASANIMRSGKLQYILDEDQDMTSPETANVRDCLDAALDRTRRQLGLDPVTPNEDATNNGGASSGAAPGAGSKRKREESDQQEGPDTKKPKATDGQADQSQHTSEQDPKPDHRTQFVGAMGQLEGTLLDLIEDPAGGTTTQQPPTNAGLGGNGVLPPNQSRKDMKALALVTAGIGLREPLNQWYGGLAVQHGPGGTAGQPPAGDSTTTTGGSGSGTHGSAGGENGSHAKAKEPTGDGNA